MILAALLFLPDTIPAHYNFAGEADRWGSKYELLIFPAILIPYGIIWTACGRFGFSKLKEPAAELIWMVGGVTQLILFFGLALYFLYTSLHRVTDLSALPVDLNRALCMITGLGIVITGNYLPKLQKPGPTGLHTPWSMKNEVVWRKSQRFGGWAMVAAGAVSIAAALLTGGIWCWLWLMLSVAAACAAGAAYSCRISKAES